MAATFINGTVAFYFNGGLVGTATFANTWTVSQLHVGAYFNTYSGFNGSVDDLRIFDRALTSAQVQSIYNQQGVPGRAVQTRVAQPLLIGNATILYGGAPTSNTAVYFPGTSGAYMLLNSTPATFDLATSNLFVECWVYFGNVPINPNFTCIVADGPTGSGGFQECWYIRMNSTIIEFAINASALKVASLSTSFSTGAWYHIAASYNSGSSIGYVFVNGGIPGSVNLVTPKTSTGASLSIGTYPAGGVYMNGYIRDLRVVKGGVVPTTSFTPQAATWAYGSVPSYVTGGTNVLGLAAQYMTPTPLTGTPLFTQMSTSATSSAVGAFSLRAVNGTTAKAVAVQAHPVVQWPPIAMTSNNFTATGTYNGIVNGVYTASGLSGGVVTTVFNMFDNNITTFYEQYYTGSNYYDYNLGTLIDTTKTTTVSGASAAGWWVQLQLPTSIILRSYTLAGRQDNGFWQTRNPTTFWIAGSNDGTTWSNVHYQSGISYGQSGTTITVPQTSNSLAYSYYRLIVNVIGNPGVPGNHSTLDISTWNLYGDSPSYAPNASQDFYADRRGNLLTAPVTGQSLASWLGGATGYVTTWYDQSGRGNHATQGTAANQPIITRATKGPGYACVFNGTTNYMNFGSSTILNGTNYSMCGITRRNTSSSQKYYIGSNGAGSTRQNLAVGYFDNTTIIINEGGYATSTAVPAYSAGSEPTGYDFVMLSQTTGAYCFSFRGGTSYPGGNSGVNLPLNSAGVGIIGAVATNGSYGGYFSGEIFELIIFTASLFDLSGSSIGQLSPIPSVIQSIYNNQLGAYGT
jgi:hypothetical protein